MEYRMQLFPCRGSDRARWRSGWRWIAMDGDLGVFKSGGHGDGDGDDGDGDGDGDGGADGGTAGQPWPGRVPAQSALDKPIATECTATFFCGHIVRIVYSFQHHVDVRADPEARGGVAVCQEGRQDFPHLEGHSRRFHRRRGCSYPGKAWFDEFAAPRSDWRTCVA